MDKKQVMESTHTLMALATMVNGLMMTKMASAHSNSQMEMSIKDNSSTVSEMDQECISMPTEIFTMENGELTRKKALEHLKWLLVIDMTENGWKVEKMEKALIPLQTATPMKATLWMVSDKAKESTPGKTNLTTREIGQKTE